MEHGARNILIIDDETVNRMALARLLNHLGVPLVIEAADGAVGLAHCAKHSFDAIICDIDMQPMDGIQFVQALRASTTSPSHQAPVIMLSKYSSGSVIRSARDVGATAYMVKPVSRDEMLDKLVRVVPPRVPDAAEESAS